MGIAFVSIQNAEEDIYNNPDDIKWNRLILNIMEAKCQEINSIK